MGDAQVQQTGSSRGFGGSGGLSKMTGLLGQMPGAGGLVQQAEQLQAQSSAQEQAIERDASRDAASGAQTFNAPPGTTGGPPGPGIPGLSANFDPQETARKIYPILEFRDKVVKAISSTIEKIPGLEALVEKITDTLTLFVLSLLAPFVRPIINTVSAQLKNGSSAVIDTSGKHQYEPWTNPSCSDPTHSMLSKDHFSNILNEPAGSVAAAILQYVAPRVIFAWQNPGVPVHEVMNDVARVFHHPALRDQSCEIHRTMFDTVQRWAHNRPSNLPNLDQMLSSESVRAGKNHIGLDSTSQPGGGLSSIPGMSNMFGQAGSHPHLANVPGKIFGQSRDIDGSSREISDEADSIPGAFPGTKTAFDNRDEEPSGAPGYEQQYQSNQYARGQEQGSFGGPPPQMQQQGYGGPGGFQGPPQGGFPQQGQQGYPPRGYGGQAPYGFDPNAPPPPGQGYGGPPPGYGGGGYYQ